ncbi:MAG: orotate phosphoribosyltransferase, partial [Chitinophagales bacterium]
MIFDDKVALTLAEKLLQIKAIKLQAHKPFKWASGWNSPIYCDNRVTLSYPDLRTYIKKHLAQLISDRFPDVQLIMGVATAGIAQGALVAEYLGFPFAYVRPEPKKHGMGKQIEGRAEIGQRVVLIEDLVSTGKSCIKTFSALEEAELELLGTAAIFSYGFEQARENFKNAGSIYYSLSDYNALLKIALQNGDIKEADLALLNEWRNA